MAMYVGRDASPFYVSCVLRTHTSVDFLVRYVSLRMSLVCFKLNAESDVSSSSSVQLVNSVRVDVRAVSPLKRSRKYKACTRIARDGQAKVTCHRVL